LAQRLEPGERVLWSARPHPTRLSYLPQGPRRWLTVGLALTVLVAVLAMSERMVDILQELIGAGFATNSFAFAALLAGAGTTVALLVAVSTYLLHSAVLLPAHNLRHTSYFVTNQRVLIQRGLEELHLDRSRVIDLLTVPALKGANDIFLVLDGPRARALALSGAFGEIERGLQLRPVLESVDDVDGVRQALFAKSIVPLHAVRAELPPAA
jgi:hypothetical protein